LRGAKLVTRTGIESGLSGVFSDSYEPPLVAPGASSHPPDASERVASEPLAVDSLAVRDRLPSPDPELFLAAGSVLASQATQAQAAHAAVEGLLRRAMDQACQLRREGL
jgi:hypothetical protein